MNIDPPQAVHASIDPPVSSEPGAFRNFLLLSVVLVFAFAVPIYRLVSYALAQGSLYSHALLIPFVSAYLVWIHKKLLPVPRRESVLPALPFALAGAGLLTLWFFLDRAGTKLSIEDFLSITIGSFYFFFVAIAVFALGSSFCRCILFPLGFLIFMVPFPDVVTTALETASKHASAEVYALLMNLFGASYFRNGLVFALPGLTIEVAQECSGIRSSLVLFITSLIAGYLFLQKTRNRIILALIVLPLGVLRNAFRILVLSLLTIHWDPRVIDSPLHHRGGPLFFALSLLPFLLLLVWLGRSEKANQRANS